MATRMKAKLKASASLPQSGEVPIGYSPVNTEKAATWKPEHAGDCISGIVSGPVKTVSFKEENGDVTARRVFELTEEDDKECYAVWESAALERLFNDLQKRGVGTRVYIRFDGFGEAHEGYSAPKLFTVGIA